ncbi:MAG: alpha/beta hydrolase [Oscillospiraceae bacterium]|jgi:non-heme chloroperoxidase|nr:alpha/beta hydrolase [Oscillospiraceae bacterium]
MVHINSNGAKIAVYEYNRECSRECGANTVLLLHGWPLSHLIFEYQINLLTELGCHVVGVDFRGFGASEAPVCGYDYNQMARDIHAVIRVLGLSGISIAGFSMGGAVALRYMRLFKGERVKKLILLAAAAPRFTKTADFPYGIEKRDVDDMIEKANSDRPELCRSFVDEKLFAQPHSRAVKNWFTGIAMSASGIGTIKAACSLRDEDGTDDLKFINVPTFIIRGEKDTVVPPSITDYQQREIKGSTLFSLKHSAHGIIYDELENFNNFFVKAIVE